MIRHFAMLPLLVLASCGPAPDRQRDGEMQAEPSDAMEPPAISPTAAPGVAFTYRYAFSLPAARISAAQEAHAQACEKLGIAQCRITGMQYRLIGENEIEAMLEFKLAPTIARGFGKAGIAAIEQADGTLVDAAITGTDAGAEIQQLGADRARGESEIQRIDRELARPGLRADERAELQRQRGDLATQVNAAVAGTAQRRDSLANTPMTFSYRSGRAIRGFDASAPFTSALDTAVASVQVTLAVLLGALAMLGPPALVVLLGWLAWRALRRRWPASLRPPVAAAPSAPPSTLDATIRTGEAPPPA